MAKSDTSVEIGVVASFKDASQALDNFQKGFGRSAESAMKFQRVLNMLEGTGSKTAGALASVLGGFAAGGPMGLALAGVQALIGYVNDLDKAEQESARKAKEAAEERSKGYKKNKEDLEKLIAARAGLTSEQFDAGKANEAALADIAARQKEVDDARAAFQRAKNLIPGARNQTDDTALKYYSSTLGPLFDKLKAALDQHSKAVDNAARVVAAGAIRSDNSTADKTRTAEEEQERRRKLAFGIVGQSARNAIRDSESKQSRAEQELGPTRERIEGQNKRKKESDKEFDEIIKSMEDLQKSWQQTADEMYATVETTLAPAFGALGGFFDDVLIQGQSLGQSLTTMFKSLGSSVIQWLSKLALQKVASEITAHILTKPVKMAEVIGQAALVGSGTAAALATNPLTVAGAIPAGVAAMESAIASFGPFASASQGWDVPWSTGGIPATLHSREMVLPKKYADAIRAMSDSGGVNGGGGPPTVINIHALDYKSFKDALGRNDSALLEVLNAARKDRRF